MYLISYQINRNNKLKTNYLKKKIIPTTKKLRNSIYILALVEDDGFRFVIGEIDTYNRGQNEQITKLKSFNILDFTPPHVNTMFLNQLCHESKWLN